MPRQPQTSAKVDRIGALEDEIKQRDYRINELRRDLDEAQTLMTQMRERIEDNVTTIEQWIEGFEMTQRDDGMWTWKDSFAEGAEWHVKYGALVRRWNAIVGEYNAKVAPRNVGRPIAASETQVTEVRKLHKRGVSLRGIVDETGLGLQTVRTIVAQTNGTDRTTLKHLSRIAPDRAADARWRARKAVRDRLPGQINEALKEGRALIKAAKGLGK